MRGRNEPVRGRRLRLSIDRVFASLRMRPVRLSIPHEAILRMASDSIHASRRCQTSDGRQSRHAESGLKSVLSGAVILPGSPLRLLGSSGLNVRAQEPPNPPGVYQHADDD